MNSTIKIIIALITLILCITLPVLYLNQHDEIRRLSQTLTHTVQQLKQFETHSGQLAAENEVMQLRLKELQILYPSLIEEIKNMRITARRTEQVSAFGYKTEKRVSVPLLDSLVSDSTRMKTFRYRDSWYDVQGQSDDSLQHLNFRYQDTLIQVIYLGKRQRPWLWVFSPRRLRQRVMLKNPNGKIEYAQVIQIQKRK